MDKKDITSTIIVAGLTILFATASFSLFISKGKSKFWTTKKIKLGAMILSFTAVASTQQACVSCYEPIIENEINIKNTTDTLNLKDSSALYGTILSRASSKYSFKLQNDTIDTIMQVSDILPDDGIYDEATEEFTINIDTSLQTGTYHLYFYDVEKEKQDDASYLQNNYFINILNEK